MNTEEYTELKKECEAMRKDIEDIKDNHLTDIWQAIEGLWGAIEYIYKDIKSLRNYVWGSAAIIAVVIALCQLLG